jgi:hypothetical protein
MDIESKKISDSVKKRYFPNGNKDIDEGMYRVSEILKSNGVDLPICRKIFIQAVGRLGITKHLTFDGLVEHLKETNELEYFAPEHVPPFYLYLMAIRTASNQGKGASDIVKNGEKYSIRAIPKPMTLSTKTSGFVETHPIITLLLMFFLVGSYFSLNDWLNRDTILKDKQNQVDEYDIFYTYCLDYLSEKQTVIQGDTNESLCTEMDHLSRKSTKEIMQNIETSAPISESKCSGWYDPDC